MNNTFPQKLLDAYVSDGLPILHIRSHHVVFAKFLSNGPLLLFLLSWADPESIGIEAYTIKGVCVI